MYMPTLPISKSYSSASRVLLVTKQMDELPSGGRELLCKLNFDALKAIYGERLVLYQLPPATLKGARAHFNVFRGHIDGLNADSIDEVMRVIENSNVGKVFVDGSNLGGLVAEMKARFPLVEATVFFHNCEARFFWGSLLSQKSVRAFAVLLANTLAERKAVRYSDKRVCLSERDSGLVKKLYGRAATHISPMALEDKMPLDFADVRPSNTKGYALFVGGDFYANRLGIVWFLRHVATRMNVPVFIVGRGFESVRSELENQSNVTVIGEVESLASWYRGALLVIAPIFDGSGMKTKVAEALMYGKKVAGTPEAFSGYESVADKVGWECRTADEFLEAVKSAQCEGPGTFDSKLRAIYIEKYSLRAAQERLIEIMED